jgi:predicted methyltransferase
MSNLKRPPTSLSLRRRQLLGGLAWPVVAPSLLGLPILGLPLTAHAAGDDLLRAVIAGAHRSEANRARDEARHPFETLRFLGLQPEFTVLEVAPGAGWYTEILAPYLLQRGQYIPAAYAHDDPQAYRRELRVSLEAKLAHRPELYGRVQVGTFSPQGDLINAGRRGSVDMVLTFRNVHNWIETDTLDTSLKAFARVLKPGGILGVEEHRAPPGTSLERIKATGYVTEALLVERARAAGFELAERSEVNANPRDSKDHPNGVWSLPPTLRGVDVDRARFIAIGESDRFTHRYVKVA